MFSLFGVQHGEKNIQFLSIESDFNDFNDLEYILKYEMYLKMQRKITTNCTLITLCLSDSLSIRR